MEDEVGVAVCVLPRSFEGEKATVQDPGKLRLSGLDRTVKERLTLHIFEE